MFSELWGFFLLQYWQFSIFSILNDFTAGALQAQKLSKHTFTCSRETHTLKGWRSVVSPPAFRQATSCPSPHPPVPSPPPRSRTAYCLRLSLQVVAFSSSAAEKVPIPQFKGPTGPANMIDSLEMRTRF